MCKLSKYLCMLLVLLMVLAVIPYEASALSVTTPTQSVTSTEYFTALPGVYEMGDGYAVIWATNFKGTGYIQYTYQGKSYTVYDMKNGIVRTGDTIHVVKVPHEHLQGNSYTVFSQKISAHSYDIVTTGTTISAGPIKLKTYDGGVDNFDVMVLTDVHGQLDWAKTVADQFQSHRDPDLVVFSGDIADSLFSKDDIVNMFNIMGSVTGGRYPTVYIRGNHETRGTYSTALMDYWPTETGEFYFDFTYGPLWCVVMDTGEDKYDSHIEYANLTNFREYHAKQEQWLRSLRMDESATYRFGIYHMPRLHDLSKKEAPIIDFTDAIGHLGLQFAVTGHMHTAEVYNKAANYATSIKHEAFICGSYANNLATYVTLDSTTQKAYITVRNKTGTIYTNNGITYDEYPIDFSQYIGEIPGPLEEPDYGLNAHFDTSSVTQSGTISINVPPTVFETGGDWYNVVWTTSTTDTAAYGTTGYVEYEYNGQTYQIFDEKSGIRRMYDEIHTVKVPKEHLNNNTYKVGSFLVKKTSSNPYYDPVDWVESAPYVFENRTGDTAVNIVACPDIKAGSATATSITAVQKAVAGLGTSPAVILVNGNVVSAHLNSTSDYLALFKATATVSGGMHPVVFSRGHAECRGYYAPNLLKYIPTATGEFYYSFEAGEYTIVNLDMAEDKLDTHSNYGGRVSFQPLREQQIDWIEAMPAGKLVVVANKAAGSTPTRYGLDFETSLIEKGAILSIGGHDTSSFAEYYETGTTDGYHIYTVIPGGWNGSRYIAASILLSGDSAYINACQYATSGTTTYPAAKSISLASGNTGAVQSYSAVQPSKVNGVYQVSKPEHIKWISANCTSANSFSGETFRLVNDIDMKLVPFTPIGGNDSVNTDGNTTSNGFAGTFDGNGYTISNLNITTSGNNAGFFGVVRNGTVKNLTISGGLVDAGSYVGGLAGFATGSSFIDCYSDLTVFSESGRKVGGMFGFLTGGTTVERCANYGHVSTHHKETLAGGIAGQIHSDTPVIIRDSFNRGNITDHSTSGIAGGLYGYSDAVPVQVINCYNAASVTCPGAQGTVVGGYSIYGTLTLTNTYYATGFNGASTAFKNTNAWSSKGGSGTVTPKSKAEMRERAMAQTLNGDVFSCVSFMNDGYPVHTKQIHPASGQHDYAVVVTPAGCMSDGYTTYTCSCGDTYVTDHVAAKGHSYQAVVTAPTCTAEGYTTHTCECGDTYVTDRVAATGHSYEAVVTAPTCTADGYTTYTCACGDSYAADAVPALGHHYNTEVVAPTCTADGSITSVCANCGDVIVEITPATGHSYEGSVTAPSCTEDGFTTYVCGVCGDTYVADVVAATGHSHKAVVTAPTCTEAGYTTYTCACGDSYVADEVPAAGHAYENGVCTDCGGVDPDYIDPSIPYSLVGDMNDWNDQTHVMSGDGTVSVTVTLAEGTYRFKIRRSYLEFGNEGVITDATADEAGCLLSPTADSCTLNASGGTYCFTFDPATSMLVVTHLTNETEHAPITNGTITLNGVSLSLEDEVVYNLYFETENIAVGEESMGLILWDQEPVLPTINGGGVVIEGAVYLPSSGLYGVRTMGIPAKNLGDLKYMVVYARLEDGSYVYSRVLQYSARVYCMSRVQKSTDENMRALCVALMNYGAEAQKYFAAATDYTYTELMNVGFEEYQYLVQPYSRDLLDMPGAVDEAKAGVFGIAANGFTSRSASVSADGTFALNYYFATSVPVEKVTMYYWTAEQYNTVDQLTFENASGSKEMVAQEAENQFWANYEDIAAKEMDQPIYVCGVYEVDGELYSTGVIAYSIAKYCVGRVDALSEIQYFAQAMVVYGYHAKAYFLR